MLKNPYSKFVCASKLRSSSFHTLILHLISSILIWPFLASSVSGYNQNPPSNNQRQIEKFFGPPLPPQQQVEYFDLGYEIIEGETLFVPGQRFEYKLFRDQEGFNFTDNGIPYWLAMYSFCIGEHGGTHVDAPFHLNQFGWKIGEIPVSHLMNIPATVVDVEGPLFSLSNPQDFVVDIQYFLEHEMMFGPIPLGSVVLVHTGWSRFWPDKQAYFGMRSDGTMNFPGISENAAKWLVFERHVVGVGIDTASIDIGNVEKIKNNHPVHITLCGNNVYIIENVANLTPLLRRIRPPGPLISTGGSQPFRFCDLRLFVLPIKTKGSGGPTRVIAQCV